MDVKLEITMAPDFNIEEKQKIKNIVHQAKNLCIKPFKNITDSNVTMDVTIKLGPYKGENRGNSISVWINRKNLDEPKDLQKLIHHEMVHFFQQIILGKNKEYHLPIWFSEGMAVAFSGQGILYKSEFILEVLEAFSKIQKPESYIFMNDYIKYDMNKEPFNDLYTLWGTMFIYTISSKTYINSEYQKDDGPHLKENEMQRAIEIIKKSLICEFSESIKQKSYKEELTPNNIKELLNSFIQYPEHQ